MAATPAPWQIALARIEGALPFLSETIAQVLAMRSLRRLWTVHIQGFPLENIGLEHNPGLEAAELMRSWYAEERRDFLSWVGRRGPPPLARAATGLMFHPNWSPISRCWAGPTFCSPANIAGPRTRTRFRLGPKVRVYEGVRWQRR